MLVISRYGSLSGIVQLLRSLSQRDKLIFIFLTVATLPILAYAGKMMFGDWQTFKRALVLDWQSSALRGSWEYEDYFLFGKAALFWILALSALLTEWLIVLQVMHH